MKLRFAKVLLPALVCGVGLIFAVRANAQADSVGANIALHKTVTVSPRSNYYWTPDRDPQQLTNGIYAGVHPKWDPVNKTSALWVQKGCLGWVRTKPVIITIDLGSVQPISGVSYSTAAGLAGVGWPDNIYIATSDDNKTWHYAGDLVALARKNGIPPTSSYVNFRFVTYNLKTHGRYISLGVIQNSLAFTDEVEVYRGDDALLNQSAGNDIPPMQEFAAQEMLTVKARQRQGADIASIRALLKTARITPAQKSTFEARLDKDADATADMAPLPMDFKTIIPLSDIHRDILAVHGEALAAQGFQPLTVWKKPHYAWIPIINMPNEKQPASLSISMLKNQIRSDSILLTNATGQPMTVKFQLQNAPKSAQDGWIQLASAIWTDTLPGNAVQDALMPMQDQNGVYSMDIPAGITGKLWVTVDTSKLSSGNYKSTFLITCGAQRIEAPLQVQVSKIAMGVPRMSLSMWDYTNGRGKYGITPSNRDAAIRLMRSHYVDPAWASSAALPLPPATAFNADNQLIAKLDFSNLDQWVAMWPGERRYFVFLSTATTDAFAGAPMGTPEFNARIGNWMKAVQANWESLGLKPLQLVICPVDESHNSVMDLHLVDWGGAIKSATPEIGIFSDPTWPDPAKIKYPEEFLIPDIICPGADATPQAMAFYKKFCDDHHKELWIYSGGTPSRSEDPQAYRLRAWNVFAAGGLGEGFWSFGDLTGAPTSWNAYNAYKEIYTPVYIEKDAIYDSVHWDAARDSVEDFEELSMLADAIKKTSDPTLKTQAKNVLNTAVETVAQDFKSNPTGYLWSGQPDPNAVDAQLAKVRAMLEKLDG